jgi:hypothetical protein
MMAGVPDDVELNEIGAPAVPVAFKETFIVCV